MSFFSKKKKEEDHSYFAFEKNQEEGKEEIKEVVSEQVGQEVTRQPEEEMQQEVKIPFGKNHNRHPIVLTPEEILREKEAGQSVAAQTDALEALKKRMQEARQKNADKFNSETEKTEQKAEILQTAEEEIQAVIQKAEEQVLAATVELPEEEEAEPQKTESPQTEPQKTEPQEESSAKEEDTESSLLERCRIYTVDENGKNRADQNAPAYQLQSVADILHEQSQSAMERLSEKYNISFDTLGDVSDESMELDPVLKEEQEPLQEEETAGEETKEAAEEIPEDEHKVISDLDAVPIPDTAEEAPSATVRFTPVAGEGRSSKMTVSSTTKTVDLTGELADFSMEATEETTPEVQLERTEFDEYKPEVEYHAKNEGKTVRKLLATKRRNSFLKMSVSILLTLIPTLLCMPFLSSVVLGNMRLCTLISLIATVGMIVVHGDMFLSLIKLKNRKMSADIAGVTASLTVVAYAITGMLADDNNVLSVLLMLAIVLLIRSVGCFFRDTVMFSNFRQISTKAPKRAVKLIRDPAVTYAMAKNSIEGDVLIAAPQRTEHVDDYMKYATFRIPLGGKMLLIAVVYAILSVILGLASVSYFNGVVYGLYSAAVVQCFCAMPILFFVEDLPLFSAAKRLNRIGSMIAGKEGAEQIAEANAVVLTSAELFPAGTVVLGKLQLLSENSIDETIIRAAALTDAMNSPLSSVFKKIASTSGDFILPEADTVKYEDKMGISGWVDDNLLFVGNRTLMEAHGIKVPDIETDRKLLRSGYFPVYVSDAEKACALLAVQYRVDERVAREVRKLSVLGVMVLVQSSDPNMTEEMICDYMGLYEDSVKIMSAAGCHMYKNAATPSNSVSAPAAYKGNPLGISTIVNTANRLCKAITKLTVLYLISAVLGAILFTYISFDGKGLPVGGEMLLVYQLICTVLSMLIYLFKKP